MKLLPQQSILFTLGACALFTLALGATRAPAEEPVPGQLDHGATALPKFEDLDKNKDGYLSKDEIPAGDELQNKFAFYDANADGRLSRDEFGRYKAEKEVARNKNSADNFFLP